MSRRSIIVLTILLAIGVSLQAQHRQILLGDSLYRFASYDKALDHYEKALKKVDDPTVVHEKLGNTWFQLHDYPKALSHYEQGDKENWQEETRWKFLQVQRALGNEEVVREYIASWASLDETRTGALESGLEAETLFYMDSAAYEISLTEFNSVKSDFGPAYYGNGLVFASSRGEGNVSHRKFHWDGGYHLDLFYVPLSGNGSIPALISAGANTVYHDGPAIFYENDKKVIFTRNETGKEKDGTRRLILMEGDVLNAGEWENIRALPINDASYSVSHPAISDDGRVLYFVSDKPGGYGGTDIWMSVRTGEGWGPAQNLGPSVNTSGNEMFPYVYREEFFFASDGHPGLGGLDIFIAERLSDNSYMVRNAGYPLNTRLDDFGFVTKNGREGYFSSNRAGQDDIYYFLKDKTLVDIYYVDQEENLLDSVMTELEGRKIPPVKAKRVTHLILPMNSVNGFKASRESFADTAFSIETKEEFYIARTIPLTPVGTMDRGTIDLYPIAAEDKVDFYLGTPDELIHIDSSSEWMKKLNVKGTNGEVPLNELENLRDILDKNGFDIVLHDTITSIFYDFDKYNIRTTEETNLSRLTVLLKKYPDARVVLSAHTDARGSNSYNDKLALRRAQAAREYLIANGINSDRIEARAYGERQLWIQCEKCTEAEHQMNRRATFGINKK